MLVRRDLYDADRGRVDFEEEMTYAPRATLALIVVLGAVFGWQLSSAALESRDAIVAAGALVRTRVLDGELWRLVTATFLHGGPDHLLGNGISLYVLGMACEHAVGWRRLLTIFAAGAAGGWLLSLAVAPGPSVGASGAIFGVMGALLVILYRHRELFVMRDKRIGAVIAVWAGYTLILGYLQPMIDNAAHIGGLLAGAALALRLPVRDAFRAAQQRRLPGRRRVR